MRRYLGSPGLERRPATGARPPATASEVGDLLDFTRSHLGAGIPVVRAETDLGRIVREVVDEISSAHPQRPIRVDTRVEQRGFGTRRALARPWAT